MPHDGTSSVLTGSAGDEHADVAGLVAVQGDPHYPYSRVWCPPGQAVRRARTMAAPTKALVTGETHLVEPGDAFTRRFTLTIT